MMKGETTFERPWLASWPEGVPKSIDYPEISVHELLRRAAKDFGNRPAITFYGKSLSYRDLDAAVDRFAAGLRAIGVRSGDRVSLVLPNTPHFVVAFWAVLRAGGIVVQTNALCTPRELASLWTDAGVEIVIALDLFWHNVSIARANAPVKRIVVCDVGEFLRLPLRQPYPIKKRRDLKKQGHWPLVIPKEAGIHRFADLARTPPGPAPEMRANPDDVAVLQYTGGTTGTSKGAMLTNRNLIANAMQVAAWFSTGSQGRDKLLGAIPLFHVYGLRSIRACISGAAPVPNEVRKQFEAATGGRLVEGYGLTEASPVTHCNPLKGVVKECIGIPFPDTDARVVDPDDPSRELAQGDVGELAVRGPQVMKGYWHQPEETATVLRDGWLLTGDLARMDEDGYFYIVDRKKDMILCSGYNVYPREVEEVLFMHPAVGEAAAIGVPDPYRGETVKAFVVLKAGKTATEADIIAFCKERLAPFKVPKAVEFATALPLTLVGKVLRRQLREQELAKASTAR